MRSISERGLSFRTSTPLIVLALLWTTVALAATPQPANIVHFTNVALTKPLVPGETSALRVEALVATGWHINSNQPLNSDYIPTVLTVTAPAGLTFGPVTYPPSEVRTLGFSGGEKLSVLTGALYFEVPIAAARN
ncbi:MAG TPA: hypothetical protein VEJ86_06580, partial [Candidatus Binataceae bacterium]|nr:hypothetical protein [Candidatus Binataceae bacterium]